MQGLTTGKSYSFAWRFGNEKGVQETLSRFSPAVTLRAATVPEPPSNVHIKVVDDALLVRWHMKESGGRPVLKFNVRVSTRNYKGPELLTNNYVFADRASYV